MPALEPGDAIEEEYVMHYPELDQTPGNAMVHTFGSFAAPILHSRLVVRHPPDASVRLQEQAGPPPALVERTMVWSCGYGSATISPRRLQNPLFPR